jgi:hypothetical protein
MRRPRPKAAAFGSCLDVGRTGRLVGEAEVEGSSMKTTYTITKGYKVFEGSNTKGEPMDEPNEDQLFAWLQSRGVSEKAATRLIERVDATGTVGLEILEINDGF